MRVLLYAQHLSGVGHHVRMREIGRALAVRHDVHLFDGGREVPCARPPGVGRIALPGIHRGARGLEASQRAGGLAAVMRRRADVMREAVVRLAPDALVVEHYPFSKWALADEITALIDAARAARRSVRVICSVRDIPRQTRHEDCPPTAWGERVVSALNGQFDALIVHGEEDFTPLVEHFPHAEEIRIPVAHTGIVAEPLERIPAAAPAGVRAPFILASVGGGADDVGLLEHCRSAWRELASRGATAGRVLVLCGGLAPDSGGLRSRGDGTGEPPDRDTRTAAFSEHFLSWLAAADLSISYAGYNTCANLLATRTPALIVANPRMSDQPARAALMHSLGAARALPASAPTAGSLAAAIAEGLQLKRLCHEIRLDGAERAARFIGSLFERMPAAGLRHLEGLQAAEQPVFREPGVKG